MRLLAFAMLTVAMLISGWLFGATTIYEEFAHPKSAAPTSINFNLVDIFTGVLKGNFAFDSSSILGIIILVILGSGVIMVMQVAGLGAASLTRIVIVVAMMGMQFFVFPFGFLLNMPQIISYPIILIYNFLLITVIIELIR